jgi:hypothetical protein
LGLSTNTFAIAVLEEQKLILIATARVMAGIPFATEVWETIEGREKI